MIDLQIGSYSTCTLSHRKQFEANPVSQSVSLVGSFENLWGKSVCACYDANTWSLLYNFSLTWKTAKEVHNTCVSSVHSHLSKCLSQHTSGGSSRANVD